MSGLFTVLIAEKEHIDAISNENRLFFEPFLDSKEIAFCKWNPKGQTLQESVPGLLDAVGRRKDWRAVIIGGSNEQAMKTSNPFDVVDYSELTSLVPPEVQPSEGQDINIWESGWKEYFEAKTQIIEKIYQSALEIPFQKLATWLCFKPDNLISNIHSPNRDNLDVNEWALEMISKEEEKPSIRLENMEREQYRKELDLKDIIRKSFIQDKFLTISYPSEIYAISPRSAENNYFDPNTYWNVHRDSEYSTFADRNMYFDRMRFMAFDLLSQSHRNFRTEYIRFLASVLIFISNPIPASAMQARKLYRLEVETDESPLCTLVTSYDKKLTATYDIIETEMDKIRYEIPGELSDKVAEALFCTSNDVTVMLDDSCETDRVFAEKDYGLFFDSPENEFHKWNHDFASSNKELNYISKQQSRSIRKSVTQSHAASEVSDVNINRLTPLQIDDVKDFTDNCENEMINSIPPDVADVSRYAQQLSQDSEEVKKVIRRRMKAKTVTVLSAICLGIYLVCFLPFLFANNGTAQTVTTAIILIASMVGGLAVILAITLIFLRAPLLRAVANYNDTMQTVMNDIRNSMNRFSKFLTAFCNVRRGHAVQNYAEKHIDVYTRGIRIRKKHQEDIRKKRALLQEHYGDYFGDKSFCDETMSRPYEYDFDLAKEYSYPAPFLAGDCRQVEFIITGNYVSVPSSYVTRILVRLEEIYEK